MYVTAGHEAVLRAAAGPSHDNRRTLGPGEGLVRLRETSTRDGRNDDRARPPVHGAVFEEPGRGSWDAAVRRGRLAAGHGAGEPCPGPSGDTASWRSSLGAELAAVATAETSPASTGAGVVTAAFEEWPAARLTGSTCVLGTAFNGTIRRCRVTKSRKRCVPAAGWPRWEPTHSRGQLGRGVPRGAPAVFTRPPSIRPKPPDLVSVHRSGTSGDDREAASSGGFGGRRRVTGFTQWEGGRTRRAGVLTSC